MKCKICNTKKINLSFFESPISGYVCGSENESITQKKFKHDFEFCPNCTMLTYKYHDDAELILHRLYSDHTTTFYNTPEHNKYLKNFALNTINEYNLNKESKILEIGCNSGYTLSIFKDLSNCNVKGIEPSKSFKNIWSKLNLEVINHYFDDNVSKTLINEKFDVIILRHVFEHINDFASFIENISKICTDSTVLLIEVPYLKNVIERKRLENISYSHRNYFSIKSMSVLLKKFNLGIIKCEEVDEDGGSILYHIMKNKKNKLNIDNIKIEHVKTLIKCVEDKKNELKRKLKKYSINEIVGYGAGAKGQHLIHLLSLEKYMKTVVDDTPEYKGKFIPGTRIKIISNDELVENKNIKAVINLAPTHETAIRKNVSKNIEFINVIEN